MKTLPMIIFRVCYEVVTERSIANGDFVEIGYYSRGGWKHEDPSDWDLHAIVAEFGRKGWEDCGRWFATCDADINDRTGEETNYSVHPPRGITSASYARLRRLLCSR